MIDHEKLGDVFVIDGMSKPISLATAAAAGKPPERDPVVRREVRRAAPRWLGSRRPPGRPGARRRRRRDHLPDRRHDPVQPHRPRLQAGVLRGVQPLDRRVLLRASRPAARPRPDRDAHAGGRHRRPPRDQGARPARRDDAGRARPSRTTTRPIYDPFWEAAIELELPLSFHILTMRAEKTRGPKMTGFLQHRARLPGRDGDARAGRRVRAPPEPVDRVRRGRRRLGAALHVPDGPRLQAPPLLAARRARSCRSCRASTSPRTSTSRSRTTGPRSSTPTT